MYRSVIMRTYKIIRFYEGSERRKVIMRRVSLQTAQSHCNDAKTHKRGVWFDGYKEE